MLPLIFLLRRRLHPQRRPDPRARAAAAADRGAQGAGLQQPRARLALPEVGARHRRACGVVDRRARRRVARAACSSSSTTSSSAFPCCSSRVPVGVVVGATALTLVAAGAGRVRRRAPRRARAARPRRCGRSRRRGIAGASLETPARRASSGHRRAHGPAQRRRATRCARRPRSFGIALRGGHPDDRLRLLDAIERLIAHAVLGRGAAGRHRQLRRAARPSARARAGAAAGRDRRRAAAHGGRAHARRPPRALPRHHRRAADAALQAHRRSRRPRRSGCRRPASCCRRCSRDVLGVSPGDTVTRRGARRAAAGRGS